MLGVMLDRLWSCSKKLRCDVGQFAVVSKDVRCDVGQVVVVFIDAWCDVGQVCGRVQRC